MSRVVVRIESARGVVESVGLWHEGNPRFHSKEVQAVAYPALDDALRALDALHRVFDPARLDAQP